MKEQPERDEDYNPYAQQVITCGHMYYDGRSAWSKPRPGLKDGNYRQCEICGELEEE